jgi:hypothetical protein
VQVSPGARHVSVVSNSHLPDAQRFEQQSALFVQLSPFTWQMPPPQWPLKQPSEQQSYAREHAMPSAKQCSAQCFSSVPTSSSHRPLQQVLLFVHS